MTTVTSNLQPGVPESAIWLYRLHEKGCAQLPLRRKRAG
jgi:hypothetical protein